MTIILAGNEAASFEKLTAALRLAAEAADDKSRVRVRKNLLAATEAATELGVYLADGRWASIALRLDKARGLVDKMGYGEILALHANLAKALRNLLLSAVHLRHGRVH